MHRFSTVLPPGDLKECLALGSFAAGVAPKHLQHGLAHAAERAEFDARRAEAVLTVDQRAHFNSCDARWLTHARMNWLQLLDEQVVVRMQRYLRQPLTILEGMVGKVSLGKLAATGAPIVIDAFGDGLLSAYHSEKDNEWNVFHNACRDSIADSARRCGVHVRTEKGRSKPGEPGSKAKKRRIADVELRGAHNYAPAKDKDRIYCDWVCGSALCTTIVDKAAAEVGAAAQAAADRKHLEAQGDPPSRVFFLALPSEADGFSSSCVNALLKGFAKTRADRDHADDCAQGAWHQYSMDELAHTHARGLALVIIRRAEANLAHLNGGGRRVRPLFQSDVEACLPVVTLSARRPGAKQQSRGLNAFLWGV